uniref:Uncharacterized protein n=1 Tax=Romanomermis culicivorax TaxID=13658 RepID=A0A915I1I4_ROMCU
MILTITKSMIHKINFEYLAGYYSNRYPFYYFGAEICGRRDSSTEKGNGARKRPMNHKKLNPDVYIHTRRNHNDERQIRQIILESIPILTVKVRAYSADEISNFKRFDFVDLQFV